MSSSAILIAGVGPRVGESTARKFAEEGWSVGLVARSGAYLEELATELEADTPGDVTALPADVTDESAVEAVFTEFRETAGSINVLLNNVYPTGDTVSGLAETGDGPLNASLPAFERAWDVMARGGFLCSEYAAADMLDNDGGTILFTGSWSSVRTSGRRAPHHSANFATRALARSMAQYLWPQGIHVAHVLVDGPVGRLDQRDWVDVPDDHWIHPDHVAETLWHLVQQPPSAWTLELDLRARGAEIRFD